MSRRILPLVFSLTLLGASACASRPQGLFDFLELRDLDNNRVEITHPGGPIRQPEIPPDLAREADERPDAASPSHGELSYRLQIEFNGSPPDKPTQKALSGAFRQASLLEKLRRSVPTDPAGLEQRLRSDLDIARDVLHAYGFYAGKASGELKTQESGASNASGGSYTALISFQTGPRYVLGKSGISVRGGGSLAGNKNLPRSLDDVGLAQGSPVLADAVLAAVGAVRESFRSHGYPYASLASARYFLDHDQRVLETEIQVEPGEEVRMGDLELRGAAPVRPKYFDAMRNWRHGELWNQEAIDVYRESLRQTGLFASVEVYPSEALNHRGERNVVVEVVGALERSIGGALRYDSDLGAGVLGYWEHRNLSGRGDRLRLEIPVWKEMQEAALQYRLPFFKRPDQDLIVTGGVLHENNDSYKLFTGSGAVGLERKLGAYWRGSVRVRGEGGQIEEVHKEERSYYMAGLPLGLSFSTTASPVDASRGVRAFASAAPYYGHYGEYFTALRTRFELQGFLPVVGEDTLVLALRGVYGSLFWSEADEVPPTIRYYSGGGGSVRGYDFRSIGPRNEENDPLGGDSLVEFSAELRWKFTPDWGLTLFTDGGMVYTDKFPNKDESILWGAGLGLRYYTPIGPVRFDVAFPVNKRSDDSAVQLYISIGQSF